MNEVISGYTHRNAHHGRGGKPITEHDFVCIGMRKFVDWRGIVRRPHKLWKMVDCDNGLIYWRDSRYNSKMFMCVCSEEDLV